MSTVSPLVSVLMPVRNGLPWLHESLASLFAQTFADHEIIVIDDGSTDGTARMLAGACDTRVRVIETAGVGIAAALNLGLRAARGTYIARQDADDLSSPERFARQVAVLQKHRDIDVVATVARYFDAGGQPVDDAWVRTVRQQQDVATTPEAIRALMPLTCCITHGSVMARAQVLRDAGGYCEDAVPAEDYDLWLRLLPRHRFQKLAEPLYGYRIHESQSGARARADQILQTVAAKLRFVRRMHPHLPVPARLAVAGRTRGDQYYRAAAAAGGFELVDEDGGWDVLAVTDFARVDEFARTVRPTAHRVGNLFVRAPRLRPLRGSGVAAGWQSPSRQPGGAGSTRVAPVWRRTS